MNSLKHELITLALCSTCGVLGGLFICLVVWLRQEYLP